MGIAYQDFYNLIKANFPGSEFSLRSTTGDDEHYELILTSKEFEGLSKVAQHRLVYDRIKIMKHELHALSLITRLKENG